jgi:hypothetical protein
LKRKKKLQAPAVNAVAIASLVVANVAEIVFPLLANAVEIAKLT